MGVTPDKEDLKTVALTQDQLSAINEGLQGLPGLGKPPVQGKATSKGTKGDKPITGKEPTKDLRTNSAERSRRHNKEEGCKDRSTWVEELCGEHNW